MEIPPYPASRPLELADKPLLDRLCEELQPRISELTFAGLYLFRNAHDYTLSSAVGSVIVRGKGYDGTHYFLPPLGGDVAAALQIMYSDGHSLYGADDSFVEEYCNSSEEVTELRDSHDYLYLREELATLPGSRFHKKKNRINYFTSRHVYSVALFSNEYRDGCLQLLDALNQTSRKEIGNSLRAEMEATADALQGFEPLGLEGVVITVNERVVAFALGERLNRETSVCHFEKADPFTDGLYQLVNREFARLLFQECRYLNREQDLGETGLRSAKLSYHPVELVKKYMVRSLL
ncbi:MAG: hypothetical protein A2076_04425 [Geobacteraceae bacterium GWC2_53_11]|nr:MAG: hypothetical protein A2076_04425 [Geobacteraceae bacterium GWC2_53_11]